MSVRRRMRGAAADVVSRILRGREKAVSATTTLGEQLQLHDATPLNDVRGVQPYADGRDVRPTGLKILFPSAATSDSRQGAV